MIELISKSRCIGCDVCVQVCPTNVFDAVPGEAPIIGRIEDCQTCFMCEAYCPADALFVAAESDRRVEVNEEDLVQRGVLGTYRKILGWGPGRSPGSELDTAHLLRNLRQFRRGSDLQVEAAEAAKTPPSP